MIFERLQALLSECKTPADRHCLMQLITEGTCERQGCGKPGRLTAQNTAYAHDLSNLHRLCEECQKEADEYWTEMWREYYSSVF